MMLAIKAVNAFHLVIHFISIHIIIQCTLFSSVDLPQDQTEGTLSHENPTEGKENDGKL